MHLSQSQVEKELGRKDETTRSLKVFVSNETYSVGKMPVFCVSINSSNSRALCLMLLGEGLRRKGGAK